MRIITDQFQDSLFRRASTLPDGRVLIRWGKSFYIVEPGVLDRLQWWRPIYLVVQLGALIALFAASLLWTYSDGTQPPSNMAYLAILVGLLSMSIDSWMSRPLKRGRQPEDDHDRLTDIWDRPG